MGLPGTVRAERGVLKPKESLARVQETPDPESEPQAGPEPVMPGPSQRKQEVKVRASSGVKVMGKTQCIREGGQGCWAVRDVM